MKIKHLFCLVGLLGLSACFSLDKDSGMPEIVVCPASSNLIFAFTVDYTTSDLLGSYVVELPPGFDSLEWACKYNSPGDFGDVCWYDKGTGTELFAGTIIWMGKGKRTFPEEITPPSSSVKLEIKTEMPKFIPIYHDEYDEQNKDILYKDVDYEAIWASLEHLQNVSWLRPSDPAYIYLYRPSVGVGDPKDWYWVIFLKYA